MDNDDAATAASWVPRAWAQDYMDMMSDDTIVMRGYSLGRECQFHEEWTSVVIDDEVFARDDQAWFVWRHSDGTEMTRWPMAADPDATLVTIGRKTVTRSVPDEVAQDDLRALLAKWRDEGRGDVALAVETLGCYVCSSGEDIFAELTREVTETVERAAPVGDCTFYQRQSAAFEPDATE